MRGEDQRKCRLLQGLVGRYQDDYLYQAGEVLRGGDVIIELQSTEISNTSRVLPFNVPPDAAEARIFQAKISSLGMGVQLSESNCQKLVTEIYSESAKSRFEARSK